MATELAGNRACAANTLPVLRWQARQWQTETRTGSADVMAVTGAPITARVGRASLSVSRKDPSEQQQPARREIHFHGRALVIVPPRAAPRPARSTHRALTARLQRAPP